MTLMDDQACRVYWGSHGCDLERGHDGPCLCTCTFVDDDPAKPLLPHRDDDPDGGNVGRPPYYGPNTSFYGEDALDVMGRVDLPGVVVSATPTRLVVGTPGDPEEWGMIRDDAGNWVPWDVYAQSLDAPSGRCLEVTNEDTSFYPGHLTVVVTPAS